MEYAQLGERNSTTRHCTVETHPQMAEDMPIGDADLSALVRTIDPIIDQLIDGAVKGALHADDLVDIGVRIRSTLHEAVARQHSGMHRNS